MASYTYTGNTSEAGIPQGNYIVALKVDPSDPTAITLLSSTQADNVTGDFTITWDDWAGRITIGAIDSSLLEVKDPVFRDQLVGDLAPLSPTKFGPVYPDTSLSTDKLTMTSIVNGWGGASSAILGLTGKFYAEFTIDTFIDQNVMVGVCDNTFDAEITKVNQAGCYVWYATGNIWSGGTVSGPLSIPAATVSGDIVGIAFDSDTGYFWVSVNGVWGNSGNPETGANPLLTGYTSGFRFACSGEKSGAEITANFGQTAYAYTAPAGFSSLDG